MTNSSATRSSFRSARYSSSSFRSEGNVVQDPLFEPYLEAGPHRMFGEEVPRTPLCPPPFGQHPRESFGYPGGIGPVTGRPASMGAVRSVGDTYYMSADVSHFEPPDVVVMAYNQCIVIHAEKVADDGSVSDTFTHKSQLPADMDPLSVSSTLTAEGMLVVSVRRVCGQGMPQLPNPAYSPDRRL